MKERLLKEYSFEMVMLQSYLLEIFGHAKKCKHNFTNTIWYLDQKVDPKTRDEIISHFREMDINCDCDVLSKLNIS